MALVPSVLRHGGLALRDLGKDDADLLHELIGLEGNAGMLNFDLPGTEEDYIQLLRAGMWSRPMACLRDAEPVGVLLNPMRVFGNLFTRLLLLLRDPIRDRVALPIYLRHLYWSFPFHRIFVELPAFQSEYREMLDWAGFHEEGSLPAHQRIGGGFHDIVVYGQLRPDFEAWAARELPALALPAAP